MVSTVNRSNLWLFKLRQKASNDGVQYLNTTSEFVVTSTDFVTKGENISNWKWLIANGLDATTSMVGKETSIRFVSGGRFFHRVEYDGNGVPIHDLTTDRSGYNHVPILLPSGDPDLLSESVAKNKALVKFNQRAYGISHRFQGGVFLGELAQTIHGIRHPAEALTKGLSAYNRAAKKLQDSLRKRILSSRDPWSARNRALIREGSRSVSGLWLENSYHWQPLLHDVDDAMNAFAAKIESKPRFQRISCQGTDSHLDVDSTSIEVDAPFTWVVLVKQVSEVSVTFRGAVGVEYGNPVPTNAALWGFDLRSFVPTMWELMPYSFLIDYFTNIGDIISGWSYGGHNIRWCNTSTRKTITLTDRTGAVYIAQAPVGYSFSTSFRRHSATSYRKSISRQTYSGSFIPMPEWRVPTSTKKLLNVGALIAQKVAGFL